MFHENIQDDAELLVNETLLPELPDGGYVEVWTYNKPAGDPPRERRVVLQVMRHAIYTKSGCRKKTIGVLKIEARFMCCSARC